MPSFYIYLISSLPMLRFGINPAIRLEDFIARCAQLIPGPGLAFIKQVISTDAYALDLSKDSILLKWKAFDLGLRNELARARAARKKISPEKFLRQGGSFDINITHIAQASLRQASILEAERYLDFKRWELLDELVIGHYFDLDFLLVYALKLSILERWVKIGASDKSEMAEKALPH